MVFFVFENESGGYILRCRKNQTNGGMASRVSRSLKPRCQGDQPTWFTISARNIGTTTAGYCEYAPYARQASKKVGNRMVLTYNDVGHNPKCPQIGVSLNKRATKRAPFLLHKFGVRSHLSDELSFWSVHFAAKMSVLRLSKVLEFFA